MFMMERTMGNSYTSLARTARLIMEKAPTHKSPDGGPETDMNDQIAVGSYQTKAFEMSNKAQKLYSNLPKNTPGGAAENAAVNLDKIFDIDKATTVSGHASDQDIMTAKEHADKVRASAKEMGLSQEHEDILNDALSRISKKKPIPKVISPDETKHPADDPRFKTPSKEFNTDRTSDRDADNVKNYLIRRNLKAQRKLKIIDE